MPPRSKQLEFGFLKPEYQLICSAVPPLSREKDLLDLIFDGTLGPGERDGVSTSTKLDPAYLTTTSSTMKKLMASGPRLDSYPNYRRSDSLRRPWRYVAQISENGSERETEYD